MSVSEAMHKISATEFIDWCLFLEREYNEPSRTDHYLVQLTYYVYLLQFILGGDPKKKPEEFVIKFDFDAAREKMNAEIQEPTEEELELQRQVVLAQQKAFWRAGLGMLGNKGAGQKVKTVMPPSPPKKKV